jgi:hypothetical protein
MAVRSGTYRPVRAHQPRGGHPWCAGCHSDKHLLADSLATLDAREQTIALAVTCTRCGDSRVLATTSILAAGLVAAVGIGRDVLPQAHHRASAAEAQ